MLEISDHPDNLIDLDNAKQYIVPRLVNIFKTYPNGEEIVEKVYYPISKCTSEYFKTDYEQAYHENIYSNEGNL